MIKIFKNKRASLNLEMALLIMLLALAVIFGLTWMGGGIATTFNDASDFLLGSGGSGGADGDEWSSHYDVGAPEPVETDWVFEDNGDNTWTAIQYTGTDTIVSLPHEHNGEPVTSVKGSIITYDPVSYDIVEVFLPDTLTSIGEFAFYCSYLETAHIQEGVLSIGESAFEWASLTSLSLPSTLKTIGNRAFYENDGVTSLIIPDGVETIGDTAFGDWDGITSVIIPDSVQTLAWGNFTACQNLSNVTIGAGLTTIKDNMFNGCSSLQTITIPNNITVIEMNAFANTGLTSITIPSSVTAIGIMNFAGCNTLTDITIQKPAGSITGAPWSAPIATVNWTG